MTRRRFLKTSITAASAALLAGCDDKQKSMVGQVRQALLDWNDGAQAALFSGERLAETFTEADITDPFPFNGFYREADAPVVEEAGYALQLGGLIANTESWTLARLRALPQVSQITRHVCVEGWSAIGKWGGVQLSEFLRIVGADTGAKYVGFTCADKYYTSIDMASALHPQTILALTFRDQVLPRKFGFPMKCRIPTKLGFKNPKHVISIFVTNEFPGGYWEDQGYNWFSGL